MELPRHARPVPHNGGMETLTRRRFALGAATLGLSLPLARPLLAAELASDGSGDQSPALAEAMAKAAAAGQPLFLAGGTYRVADVAVPDNLKITGIPGVTVLALASGGRSILKGTASANVTLEGISFDGEGGSGDAPLVDFTGLTELSVSSCRFAHAAVNALSLSQCGGRVENCTFTDSGSVAIFATDSRGLAVTGNRIDGCGNGGILVWRSEAGSDGTIVMGNRIADIDWRSGGNGQNGNGINVFRADDVIIASNHISGCAFSAVRINAGRNNQVTGNTCLDCGETAIFSEFGFSGSAIANNVIDGAATGISIANLDSDGHLATCTGNIVRNIAPVSRTNPDTTPVGIFAEADVAITGNVVEGVPGPGIVAGWGPYLRNVLVSSNVVRDADIGIAVSVAEGAGSAQVTGNIIDARGPALAGMAWADTVSANLADDAGRFPNVIVSGNQQAVKPALP
jgi:uncharacterized secreted repeat protein (TIGR03808 family)